MLCVKCGTQLPDTSAFCNKCGASQAPAASPGAAPPPAPPPSSKDDAPEEAVWSGRYSAKAAGHWWLLWILAAAVLVYVRFFALPAEWRTRVASYIMLGLLAVPALAILWDTLYRKLTLRYKLSTHRFFKESGFISRHVNELELIRVDDVSVRQNIIQRIFN